MIIKLRLDYGRTLAAGRDNFNVGFVSVFWGCDDEPECIHLHVPNVISECYKIYPWTFSFSWLTCTVFLITHTSFFLQ